MQEEKLKVVGKCLYCNAEIDSKQMVRHLTTHLKNEESKENVGKPTNEYAHLVVSAKPYFLHLLVNSKEPIDTIDNFLRRIWLDCCQHMSSFMYKRDEFEMDELVGDVFIPDRIITHIYDWGSSTECEIKLIRKYQLQNDDDIILLSRNEMFKETCSTCQKPFATFACAECEGEAFCNECAEIHGQTCEAFEEYGRIRIVNSPRTGVCGYEGGRIDKERDSHGAPPVLR